MQNIMTYFLVKMMLKLNSSYLDPWCLVGSFPSNPTRLFAPPSPINITTTARYHIQFAASRNLSRQTSPADLSPGQNNSSHLHIDTQFNNLNLPPPINLSKQSPMESFFLEKIVSKLFWGGVGEGTMKPHSFFLTS